MENLEIETEKAEIPACAASVAAGRRNLQSEIGKWMVVGEVMATKPAWKRRRGSETDDELLQWLADGLGKWIAAKQKPAGRPLFAPVRPQDWRAGDIEDEKAQQQESS